MLSFVKEKKADVGKTAVKGKAKAIEQSSGDENDADGESIEQKEALDTESGAPKKKAGSSESSVETGDLEKVKFNNIYSGLPLYIDRDLEKVSHKKVKKEKKSWKETC